MLKIAFTGPESSGKTTLSIEIAKILKADFHEEYAREYLLNLDRPYNQNDLLIIAQKQLELRENHSSSIQVYDTEMLVIKIWNDFKFKIEDKEINQLFLNEKIDHYFLCKPDIPYEDDPLRENPTNRDKLFEIYLAELKKYNLPFSIIEGNMNDRINHTLNIINQLQNKNKTN